VEAEVAKETDQAGTVVASVAGVERRIEVVERGAEVGSLPEAEAVAAAERCTAAGEPDCSAGTTWRRQLLAESKLVEHQSFALERERKRGSSE
jgi:hypothetical protein